VYFISFSSSFEGTYLNSSCSEELPDAFPTCCSIREIKVFSLGAIATCPNIGLLLIKNSCNSSESKSWSSSSTLSSKSSSCEATVSASMFSSFGFSSNSLSSCFSFDSFPCFLTGFFDFPFFFFFFGKVSFDTGNLLLGLPPSLFPSLP